MKNRAVHKKFYRTIMVSLLVASIAIVTSMGISAQMRNETNTDKELIINDADTIGETNVVTYTGDWDSSTQSADQFHSDEHWANYKTSWVEGNEPSYTLRFTGTKIELYGNKAPGLGTYKVSIDGNEVGTINATATARKTQQLLYTSPELDQGSHDITVRATASSAKNIQFDYARVFYEEPVELEAGKITLGADTMYKDQVGDIQLSFADLPTDHSFYAAEFIVKFDQAHVAYHAIRANQESIIVKAKELADGRLHILVSAREKINQDTVINLEMMGKAITDSSTISVEKAEISDEEGTIALASVADATINIKVVDAYVPATGITVNKEQVELIVDETETIVANIIPEGATNKQISWVSSNPNVAEVAFGKITAKSAGTAIISATAEEGKVTKDIQVSVKDKPVEPEDTTLTKAMLKSVIDEASIAINTQEFKSLSPSVQEMIITTHAMAQVVYQDEMATNAQCTKAWMELSNALKFMDVQKDKVALLKLVETCQEINTNEYTQGVEEFKAALRNAQHVYEDETASILSVKEAYARLDKARIGLVKSVDNSQLLSFIADIDKEVGNGDNYKKDANWTVFMEAMKNAKALAASSSATQEDIVTAISDLSEAYKNLCLLPSEEQMAQLHNFVSIVSGINRDHFTKEQLKRIDETMEKVNALIQDFDANQFELVQKEMTAVLVMIKDVIPPSGPETSDNHNTEAMLITLLISGCGVVFLQKLRKHKHSNV